MRTIFTKFKQTFKEMDKPLFFFMLIIIIYGLLNIVTASSRETVVRYDKPLYYYFFMHSIMLGVSFVGSLVLLHIPTKYYRLLAPLLYIGVLGLLVYLSIQGIAKRGSINWLKVFGFTFQPSEFAKPVLIICLSLLFEQFYRKLRNTKIGHFDMIGWILGVGLLIPVIVFLQGDLGTALIILGIFFVLFLASPILKIEKFKTFLFLAFIGIVGLVFIYGWKGHVLTDTQMERFDFFNPCSKYEDNGYQICNGFIAINDGSFFGLGIGKSKQKYSYIPDPHTDSVFAIIAEETGFFFGTILFIILLLIIRRVLKISMESTTIRGRYICLGVAVYMFLHILLNLGGLFGIMPLTGVPLPFLSYGGTFTISLICSLAIVQRVHIESTHHNMKLE